MWRWSGLQVPLQAQWRGDLGLRSREQDEQGHREGSNGLQHGPGGQYGFTRDREQTRHESPSLPRVRQVHVQRRQVRGLRAR